MVDMVAGLELIRADALLKILSNSDLAIPFTTAGYHFKVIN